MTAEPHSSPTLANMAMVARVEVMGLNIQAASTVILCAPRFQAVDRGSGHLPGAPILPSCVPTGVATSARAGMASPEQRRQNLKSLWNVPDVLQLIAGVPRGKRGMEFIARERSLHHNSSGSMSSGAHI